MGEESPGPFLGSGPSVHTPSAPRLRARKVGAGGWRRPSGPPGWWGGAVWEPGSWVCFAPQEPGAGPAPGAGGRSGQQAELAGSGGQNRAVVVGAASASVPRVSEDRERVAARLCAWEVGSQTLPLSTPRGKTQAPHSKGVCVPPGEEPALWMASLLRSQGCPGTFSSSKTSGTWDRRIQPVDSRGIWKDIAGLSPGPSPSPNPSFMGFPPQHDPGPLPVQD